MIPPIARHESSGFPKASPPTLQFERPRVMTQLGNDIAETAQIVTSSSRPFLTFDSKGLVHCPILLFRSPSPGKTKTCIDYLFFCAPGGR